MRVSVSILLILLGFFFLSLIIHRQNKGYYNDLTMQNATKCSCRKNIKNNRFTSLKTTCPSSKFRGANQKVISYSFYGNTNSSYFKSINSCCKAVATLYPGWSVRLYHNISPNDTFGMQMLCDEVCANSNLDECYVGDLSITKHFPNIESKFGMLWRFLVLGDPSVQIFQLRDLDSEIHQREVDAVHDWLTSGKAWHIMRDNIMHDMPILGGMWGARNDKNLNEMQTICHQLISNADRRSRQYDQELLNLYVWPEARKDMVAHDSFLCDKYPGSKPWPTPRQNRNFVGDIKGLYIEKECPLICRPKNHQDWLYC